MACILWKIKVQLQLILAFLRASAALIPSQVAATFIKILLISIPFYLYN